MLNIMLCGCGGRMGAAVIAAARGITAEELLQQTTENTRRLFRL